MEINKKNVGITFIPTFFLFCGVRFYFFRIIMVTAVIIRAIPAAIVSEKDSPNIVMPTITAVTGSIAPKTEVCVAPMCLIASTKVRLDTTVGIMASNSRLVKVERSGTDWMFPEIPIPDQSTIVPTKNT